MSKSHSNIRVQKDIMKLIMAGYQVDSTPEEPNTIYVHWNAPEGTPYYGFCFRIRVEFPQNYAYRSPSCGFATHIYHTNVDFSSGSICLDVLSQNWSPMYNLNHVFDVFLQQLLLYPNPNDPLNGEAARLLLRNPEEYNKKARAFCEQHAVRVENATKKVTLADKSEVEKVSYDDLSDVSDSD
ncbi:hypothetical protein RCL1_004774 [Eukaryota sp. TZLM3-RCL]